MGVDLPALARSVRTHPAVTAKAEIGLVSDVFQSTTGWQGRGTTARVVTHQGVSLVVGGEAILPLVRGGRSLRRRGGRGHHQRQRPGGHGRLAAGPGGHGHRPARGHPARAGGHALGLGPVRRPGGGRSHDRYLRPPGLSAFGLGRADFPLSAQAAASGQSLMLGCCLDGQMRARLPVLPLVDERGTKLAGDVRAAGRGRGESGWGRRPRT